MFTIEYDCSFVFVILPDGVVVQPRLSSRRSSFFPVDTSITNIGLLEVVAIVVRCTQKKGVQEKSPFVDVPIGYCQVGGIVRAGEKLVLRYTIRGQMNKEVFFLHVRF